MEENQVPVMPQPPQVTVEDAIARINSLPFPAKVVGDIAWCDGHRFVYQETGWVSQPQE